MSNQNVRVAAVRVIAGMQSGGGSLTALLPAAQQNVSPDDRALLQAFCYGMARWSQQLHAAVEALLSKPMKAKDLDVHLLMQLGILQLSHMRIAEHAAVDQTVKSVKALGKPWAKGLVNAVLRNFQRESDSILNGMSTNHRLSYPEWMLTQLKSDWPENWESIAFAGNEQAPMTLRVNSRAISVSDYLERLKSANIDVQQHKMCPDAITLDKPLPVSDIPGFTDGLISVQDAAAQLAAGLLGDGIDRVLLDACAAPGGKTAHALEHGKWKQVVALDKDEQRLDKVTETLQRLKLESRAVVKCAEAEQLDTWWNGETINTVLLDAPCSGSGVIRRHPDIKLLRRFQDMSNLAAVQSNLLDALWKTVETGGRLLYATCSIFKSENEQQVDAFVQRTVNARVVPIDLGVGRQRSAGYLQILPGEEGMDGFFYALLEKT